jgi:hypothetical protein
MAKRILSERMPIAFLNDLPMIDNINEVHILDL